MGTIDFDQGKSEPEWTWDLGESNFPHQLTEHCLNRAFELLSTGKWAQAQDYATYCFGMGMRNPGLRCVQGLALGLSGEVSLMQKIFAEPQFVEALENAPELQKMVEEATKDLNPKFGRRRAHQG